MIKVDKENIRRVISQMKAKYQRQAKAAEVGMKRAGLFLQRESMEIVPVDTGNLKASSFTRHTGQGFTTVVIIGYTAAYAIFVHENLNAAHGREYNIKYAKQIARGDSYYKKITVNYKSGKVGKRRVKKRYKVTYHKRGENQQAKYLEQPVRKLRRDIIRRIVKDIKKVK